MKKKQVLAVSSALMIGTTTALTGLPTPVMAQENTEVVQEAIVEANKTEQVPVEQKTENAEVQENITDKEHPSIRTLAISELSEFMPSLISVVNQENAEASIPGSFGSKPSADNWLSAVCCRCVCCSMYLFNIFWSAES